MINLVQSDRKTSGDGQPGSSTEPFPLFLDRAAAETNFVQST